MRLEFLFRHRPGPRRWINVPFIVLFLLFSLLGAHEGISGIWLYLLLLPLFAAQLIWPTLCGWILTIVGWMVITGLGVYYGYVNQAGIFDAWLLVDLLLLVLLLWFRPVSSTQ